MYCTCWRLRCQLIRKLEWVNALSLSSIRSGSFSNKVESMRGSAGFFSGHRLACRESDILVCLVIWRIHVVEGIKDSLDCREMKQLSEAFQGYNSSFHMAKVLTGRLLYQL